MDLPPWVRLTRTKLPHAMEGDNVASMDGHIDMDNAHSEVVERSDGHKRASVDGYLAWIQPLRLRFRAPNTT